MSNLQDRLNANSAQVATTRPVAFDDEPDWSDPNSLYQKAGHLAKLFCIASAMIIPNVLIIVVLL